MYIRRRVVLFNRKREQKIFEFNTQAEEDAVNNGNVWHENPAYWNKKEVAVPEVEETIEESYKKLPDLKDEIFEPEIKFTEYKKPVGRPKKDK